MSRERSILPSLVAEHLITHAIAEISIFGTGCRATRLILELIWQKIIESVGRHRVLRYNRDALEIVGNTGCISKCFTYAFQFHNENLNDVKQAILNARDVLIIDGFITVITR